MPAAKRSRAEQRVARDVIRHPWFISARNIALYLAFDGELDLTQIHRVAARQRKRVFVPQLGRSLDSMCFVPSIHAETPMTQNRYGIREPAAGHPIDPRSLDLVLVPLVGFDSAGTRIGMGGGHYDRVFSFLNTRRVWRHPKLLGVGFQLQYQTTLPREPWDVMLHAPTTEQQRYFFP